jgi:hypothetical protein
MNSHTGLIGLSLCPQCHSWHTIGSCSLATPVTPNDPVVSAREFYVSEIVRLAEENGRLKAQLEEIAKRAAK